MMDADLALDVIDQALQAGTVEGAVRMLTPEYLAGLSRVDLGVLLLAAVARAAQAAGTQDNT